MTTTTVPGGFEVHLTFDPFSMEDAEAIVKTCAASGPVKVSHLKGDAVMGDDKLMYFTFHDQTYSRAFTRMTTIRVMAMSMGHKALREKIEMILHDVRYKK